MSFKHSVFMFVLFLATAPFLMSIPPALALDLDAEGWAFSGGIFNTVGDEPPIELGIEYRLEPRELPLLLLRDILLVPVFGFSVTEDESVWGYAGLRHDWEFSPNWYLTPQFGLALYERGEGKVLGGEIEFRSGLEISRRLEGGSRLGLAFYHLSNSSIYDFNPGANSLVLTWSLGH